MSQPPPYNPYGQQPQQPQYPQHQQQQPYPQQPYPPQQQHPQHPQHPQHQQPWPPQPYAGGPAPQPQRPRGNRPGGVVRGVAIVLALIVAGVWMYFSKGNTTGDNLDVSGASSAQVGDCMQNTGTEDDPVLKIVECGDSTATLKVEEDEALDYTCTKGDVTYQETRNGRVRFTLCLSKIAK